MTEVGLVSSVIATAESSCLMLHKPLQDAVSMLFVQKRQTSGSALCHMTEVGLVSSVIATAESSDTRLSIFGADDD
jgi:hypothetical protein